MDVVFLVRNDKQLIMIIIMINKIMIIMIIINNNNDDNDRNDDNDDNNVIIPIHQLISDMFMFLFGEISDEKLWTSGWMSRTLDHMLDLEFANGKICEKY